MWYCSHAQIQQNIETSYPAWLTIWWLVMLNLNKKWRNGVHGQGLQNLVVSTLNEKWRNEGHWREGVQNLVSCEDLSISWTQHGLVWIHDWGQDRALAYSPEPGLLFHIHGQSLACPLVDTCPALGFWFLLLSRRGGFCLLYYSILLWQQCFMEGLWSFARESSHFFSCLGSSGGSSFHLGIGHTRVCCNSLWRGATSVW